MTATQPAAVAAAGEPRDVVGGWTVTSLANQHERTTELVGAWLVNLSMSIRLDESPLTRPSMAG